MAAVHIRWIAHYHKLPRVLHRQHLEHYSIHQAEDGGVRAYAKRQREHGNRGKGRILAQHAQGVSEVLKEGSHESPATRINFEDRTSKGQVQRCAFFSAAANLVLDLAHLSLLAPYIIENQCFA